MPLTDLEFNLPIWQFSLVKEMQIESKSKNQQNTVKKFHKSDRNLEDGKYVNGEGERRYAWGG